jgi:hypothetical protein
MRQKKSLIREIANVIKLKGMETGLKRKKITVKEVVKSASEAVNMCFFFFMFKFKKINILSTRQQQRLWI